jgi:hypothetical protein
LPRDRQHGRGIVGVLDRQLQGARGRRFDLLQGRRLEIEFVVERFGAQLAAFLEVGFALYRQAALQHHDCVGGRRDGERRCSRAVRQQRHGNAAGNAAGNGRAIDGGHQFVRLEQHEIETENGLRAVGQVALARELGGDFGMLVHRLVLSGKRGAEFSALLRPSSADR